MTKDTHAREAIRAIVKSVVVGSGHNDEERQAILAILNEPNEETVKEPELPDGWYRLKVGDKIERGDRFSYSYTNWESTNHAGTTLMNYDCPYIRKSPEIEKISIPAGWKVTTEHVHPKGTTYIYHDPAHPDLPKEYHGWTLFKGKQWGSAKGPCIRQKINIDLSKQPVELVAWAMDENNKWFGFGSSEIKANGYEWVRQNRKPYRELLKSEYPDYTGDWKDSLIVRPL